MGERPQGVNSGHIGYGFGPTDRTLAGWPHFQSVCFEGSFPMARLKFRDSRFPGKGGNDRVQPVDSHEFRGFLAAGGLLFLHAHEYDGAGGGLHRLLLLRSPFPIGSSSMSMPEGIFSGS